MAEVAILNTERAQRLELGQRIYRTAENIRLEALASVELEFLDAVQPKVELTALKSNGLKSELRAVFTIHRQISADEPVTRGIITQHGVQLSGLFQPDGSTWQENNSSDGSPWREVDMPFRLLAEMATRLDRIQNSDSDVNIVFSGHRPATT